MAHIFGRFGLRWVVYEWQCRFEKSAPNDTKPSSHVQGQSIHVHTTYILRAQFSIFRFTMTIYKLWPKFEKSAPNDHVYQIPWHFKSQKYPYAYYKHARGPNVIPFSSTMSHIWPTCMIQFWERCTEWPKVTLTFSTPIVAICKLHVHTPPRPKFSFASFYNELFFELQPNLEKSALVWMTPERRP